MEQTASLSFFKYVISYMVDSMVDGDHGSVWDLVLPQLWHMHPFIWHSLIINAHVKTHNGRNQTVSPKSRA